MTTVISDNTSLVGYATYIEANRVVGAEKYTLQILMTPEVPLSPLDRTITPAGMYRRRISTSHPRATWKNVSCGTNTSRLSDIHMTAVGDKRLQLITADLFSPFAPTFHTLRQHYTIVKEPIVVEVSRADLEDIRLGKTPYKVFGRVWKSRKSLGFPAEFL